MGMDEAIVLGHAQGERGEPRHEDACDEGPGGHPGDARVQGGVTRQVEGRFAFAKAIERDTASGQLGSSGMLVVELEGIGPSFRGRLGDAIDDAIECQLSARGASGPGLTSASDCDATLSDQLFRARRIGAAGIAIVLGPLRAAAGAGGALEPEDCATLRFLASAASDRPVVLLLDERDAKTTGYAEPVALERLLPPSPAPPAIVSIAAHAPPVGETIATVAHAPEHSPIDRSPTERPALERPTLERHVAGASVVDHDEAWRTWTLQLVAARGPQPLAALERLFGECYMPLANALAGGLDDARARAAHDEFRSTFSKSYSEAFPTFSATTKRPRMVLDVHDCAARIARLHGARSTRMLLVDAMRWDVAHLVEERLVKRLGERAALTDELLLWSALPTTTMRQLETIARGVDALRSPGEMDADAEPPRGRTAEYVRRLRVGPREVHKLDVVESRLQGARGGVLRALPEIADAAADAIARHVETLSPKTLLFVFGDHGFTIDRTGAARQGGASPEEVLVGAFALLLGDMH
jgi:hypothetical protein